MITLFRHIITITGITPSLILNWNFFTYYRMQEKTKFRLQFIFLLIAVSCKNDEETPAPFITGVTPLQGIAGSVVVLAGGNFSPTAGDNVVMFNHTQAQVTSASTAQITTVVPANASTGKITITVNGQTATSPTDFIVILPPSITSFSPLVGTPGSTVTITGTNFNTDASTNTVLFNDTPAEITSTTSTQLTVVVPDGATTGKIRVSANTLTSLSELEFEVLKDIPRLGLIAFYPFTGNANDASGNGLHGTPVSGPVLSTDRYGKAGQSFLFDGKNDYIYIGNHSLLQMSGTLTVSGWINLRVLKTNTASYIISKLGFSTGNPVSGYSANLKFAASGNPSFQVRALSTTDDRSFQAGSAEAGSWVFFAIIIDGTNWKLYQNTSLVKDETVSSALLDDGTQGEFTIGTFGTGGFFFDGHIDDVTIYDRALSAQEITQLYEQTVSKY